MTREATVRQLVDSEPAPQDAEIIQWPQPQPQAIWEQTRYAVTRRDADGRMEFASLAGQWVTDMADAHMRAKQEHAAYSLPAIMDKTGSAVSQITFRLYASDLAAQRYPGDRIDRVVVAQEAMRLPGAPELGVPDSVFAKDDAPLRIVAQGGIGREDVVSDDIHRAVILPADDFMAAKRVRQMKEVGANRPQALAVREMTRRVSMIPCG